LNHQDKATNQWPPLVDPQNGKELILKSDKDGNYYLESGDGDPKYNLIKGIPRLLKEYCNYASAFGEQWIRWRKTQLDSFTGTSISRDRLNRCLGGEIIKSLNNESFNIQTLEVGCGAGRFTEILLQYPAIQLTSMDLSNAVEANALNFPSVANHRIIQADIMEPPFNMNQFDLVICLGVIQHTPNPELTIKKLFELLKPGGSLIFDHYRPEWRRFTKVTALLLRPIIKRLSNKTRFRVCEILVSLFLPIHKRIKNYHLLQYLFSRISPIISYYHVYPNLNDDLQKEWALLDTHDSLTDWFKHLRTKKQINELLSTLHAMKIEISESDHGVEVRCSKDLL